MVVTNATTSIYDMVIWTSSHVDALSSPEVNPLEGSPKCNCGKRDSEGRFRLPTLERGRRSSWEPVD